MGMWPCFILGLLPLCVMAASSLDDVMRACGFDPGVSTEWVAGGWTAIILRALPPRRGGF